MNMDASNLPIFVSGAEAARMLGANASTIHQAHAHGRIQASAYYRSGESLVPLFTKEAIEEYAKGRRTHDRKATRALKILKDLAAAGNDAAKQALAELKGGEA